MVLSSCAQLHHYVPVLSSFFSAGDYLICSRRSCFPVENMPKSCLLPFFTFKNVNYYPSPTHQNEYLFRLIYELTLYPGEEAIC